MRTRLPSVQRVERTTSEFTILISNTDDHLRNQGFRVSETRAAAIVGQVSTATERWRNVAQAMGLGTRDIERLESAFVYEQRAAAREH